MVRLRSCGCVTEAPQTNQFAAIEPFYVSQSLCQQARYVHPFVHHLMECLDFTHAPLGYRV